MMLSVIEERLKLCDNAHLRECITGTWFINKLTAFLLNLDLRPVNNIIV